VLGGKGPHVRDRGHDVRARRLPAPRARPLRPRGRRAVGGAARGAPAPQFPGLLLARRRRPDRARRVVDLVGRRRLRPERQAARWLLPANRARRTTGGARHRAGRRRLRAPRRDQRADVRLPARLGRARRTPRHRQPAMARRVGRGARAADRRGRGARGRARRRRAAARAAAGARGRDGLRPPPRAIVERSLVLAHRLMPAVTLHHRFWPPGRPQSLDYPRRSLYENLRLSAQRHPTRPMIVFHRASHDYARCLHQVDRLAGYLQHECGVARGDRVLLDLQNSPQWILAYYAILRADAMVVPVNPMLRAAELAHVAADSGAAVAVAAQDLVVELPPGLRRTIVVTYRDCAGDPPPPDAPEAVRAAPLPLPPAGAFVRWSDALATGRRPRAHLAGPDDLAVMPYSSGTTGRPKGCVHTHRSAMATALMHARWSDWGDAPVVLATLPLFHVTGMQSSMNAPILLGATIVVLQRWDRDAAAAAIERHHVTSWGCITTMAIDLLSAPGIEQRDLSSLRRIGGGGAGMPAAIAARLRKLTGLEYVEGYGLSETMAPTHINPPQRAKRQCAGVPLFDVDARIVDPVSKHELGPNESGEIV